MVIESFRSYVKQIEEAQGYSGECYIDEFLDRIYIWLEPIQDAMAS